MEYLKHIFDEIVNKLPGTVVGAIGGILLFWGGQAWLTSDLRI